MNFIGRNLELSTLVRNDKGLNKFCITSPTGIGKSDLLKQVEVDLTQQGVTCLTYAIEPNASSVQDVTVDLLRQLLCQLDDKSLSIEDFAKHVKDNAGGIALSTLSALLSDGVRFLAPSLRKTASVVFDQIQAAGIATDAAIEGQKLIENHSNITKTLTDLLKCYSEQGGKVAVILDNIESSSDEVVNLIKGLAMSMPSSSYMYMALNDEINEGREFLKDYGDQLSFAEVEYLNLEPLPISIIQEWHFNETGEYISTHRAEEASSICEGRTFYLKEWMDGGDLQEISDSLSKKVGPGYSKRINALSENAKKLIYSLCIFPEKITYDPLLIMALIDVVPVEFVSILKELEENGILCKQGNHFCFRHETVRRTIRAQIPDDLLQPISHEILTRLSSNQELSIDSFVQLKLNYQAEHFDYINEHALEVANNMQKTGKIGASNQAYSMMKQSLQATNQNISEHIFLGEINNNLLAGKYGACMDQLHELRVCKEPSPLNIKLDVLESRCLLRLNKYKESFIVAARVQTSSLATYEQKVDALRTINTLYRDTGKYSHAIKIADIILEYFNDGRLSSYFESKVFRTMARTYALSGRCDEAIEYSKQAINGAMSLNSTKDLGNAYLADGESYRHNDQLSEAIKSYKQAIEISRSIGNIDCLIWSTLGLSDAYFLNDDIEKAKITIDSISSLLSNSEFKHPIEFLHWNLIKYSIDYIECGSYDINIEQVMSKYGELEIFWPKTHIEKLTAGESEPKLL
jgi:tetratricopeptide (TPR) repeat protein